MIQIVLSKVQKADVLESRSLVLTAVSISLMIFEFAVAGKNAGDCCMGLFELENGSLLLIL